MKCPQPTGDIRGPRITDQLVDTIGMKCVRALTHVNTHKFLYLGKSLP
jgi:hypothetical protein